MRKKLLTLIFLFPLILVLFLFSFSFSILPSLNDVPDRISFNDSFMFIFLNEKEKLDVAISPFKEEYQENIIYESLNEDVVKVEKDDDIYNCVGLKEGRAVIKASYKDSSYLTSYINVIVLSKNELNKNGLYVFDDNISYNGINTYLNESPKKGRYQLNKDLTSLKVNEVNAFFYLDIFDFTLSNVTINDELIALKEVEDINIIKGDLNITFDYSLNKYKVEILSNEDIEIEFINKNNLKYTYKAEVVDDSYFINSYFDLVYLTNHKSNKYNSPLIMNTSLDSASSSFTYNPSTNIYEEINSIKPLLLTKNEKELLESLNNNNNNSNNIYSYFYKEVDLSRIFNNFSSSLNYKENDNSSIFYIEYLSININDINNDDYRFLDRIYASKINNNNTNSSNNNLNYYKSIKVGINLSSSLYGNGYMINFNDLTFPSGTINYVNNTSLTDISSFNDCFKGPLKVVGILNEFKNINNKYDKNIDILLSSLYKYKDDNISILINNINNIILDNIIIKGCNNKTSLNEYRYIGNLIGIYNSKNIILKDLSLSNSRNIIYQSSSSNIELTNSLLMNSYDNLIKLTSSSYKAFLSFEDSLNYEFINDDSDNNIDNTSNIDNDLTIENNIFYSSGFASIFIDNHLNGPILYNSSFNDYFSFSLPLGGVSKGSKVNIKGSNYFYDFKRLDELNISSIFESDNSSFSNIISSLNISSLLNNEFNKEENKVYLFGENNEYISTPIISLGGGNNFSKVDISSSSLTPLSPFKGEDGVKVEEDSIFYMIFGNGSFKFYLYKNDDLNTLNPSSKLDLSLIRY